MRNKTKLGYIVASVVLLAGVFVIGTYVGYKNRPFAARIVGVSGMTNPTVTADFEPFWKVWNAIDEKYPEAGDISTQERVYGAISGLMDSLDDPYSVYFPPEDAQDFQETISGSFEGIGMEVGIKEKVLTVIAPLKNTPAERAGIKAGDLILKIDDTVTSDMTVDKAIKLIRGKKGTPVVLTILRKNEESPREVSIIRDTIAIPTIETKLRDDGIFVITLYNFNNSSDVLMERALREFLATGSTKLIIDLRSNPGGYLDAAVNMASFFLPQGEVVVTEDFGKNGDPKAYRSRGFDLIDTKKVTTAILVDGGSASASEILAGALSEHHVATLIGEKTYGKGSVQEVLPVTGDTLLKITVAKWLTPNGVSISKAGLKPDISVTVTEEDIEAERDPIMLRAVEFFKTGK